MPRARAQSGISTSRGGGTKRGRSQSERSESTRTQPQSARPKRSKRTSRAPVISLDVTSSSDEFDLGDSNHATPEPRQKKTSKRGTKRGQSQSERSETTRAQPQSARPKRGKNTPRPPVISLDVTYSSDDFDLGDSDPPTPEPQPKTNKPVFTPSPPPAKSVGRGIMSDSESECEEVNPVKSSPATEIPKLKDVPNDNFDDDSDNNDIFALDFNSYRNNAMKDAMKEMKETMACEEKTKITREPKKDLNISSLLDLSDVEEEKKPVEDDDVILDEISTILDSPCSLAPVAKGSRKRTCTRNKDTKKAMKVLQAFAKEISKEDNDSFNKSDISDIMVLSDDESDKEMNIRVRWGSEYLRLPIKKMQKLSHIYQTLAERFSVGVGQIVLSHKDKIVNPEVRPKDLGLTIADLLEGGIQSEKSAEASENNAPGTIKLKVQNAEKKGVVNIYISRYDKMQVLMQKYANEKKVDLSTLRFHFDGEKLDPSDTPESLDLDGDECIDVFFS